MPEGDTILRTANNLRRWIAGREVTAVRSVRRAVPLERVVGASVVDVEARAKHLLITFSNGLTLHTHMRMTGSWHVYGKADRWQKPDWQARVVLECGERLAVCFNAPVVELLSERDVESHGSLEALGPDVLSVDGIDFGEVWRRVEVSDPACTIGELLLDQRVVSGIGNIYRCEALFLEKVSPFATRVVGGADQSPVGVIDRDLFVRVVATASRLMQASVVSGTRAQRWVYDRAGLPCRRCGAPVESQLLGEQPRKVFWCPACQPT